MALMAWIIRRHGLSRMPEVLAISERLNISPVHVSGCCCEIWEWADGQADEDGYVCGATPGVLDRIVGVPGFADAMATPFVDRAGKDRSWLQILTGGLRFPRWDRWNGKSAKTRRAKTVRQQRWRDNQASTPPSTGAPTERLQTVSPSSSTSSSTSLAARKQEEGHYDGGQWIPRRDDPEQIKQYWRDMGATDV